MVSRSWVSSISRSPDDDYFSDGYQFFEQLLHIKTIYMHLLDSVAKVNIIWVYISSEHPEVFAQGASDEDLINNKN